MSPTNRAPTIAIVGGGAIGAALFAALVERLPPETTPARLVLVEKSDRIGRGLAYAKDESPYLLNQSAQTMSLVPGRKAHFREWLAARGPARAGEEELFCARELFGDYVEDCFARAVETAGRRGLSVTILRDEVTGLTPRASGYRVLTGEHAPVDADIVVLALGNLPSTRFRALRGPGFVASPYPGAELRKRISKDARVAILGSGLSAIDAVLALSAAGHEAPITMLSRSGLLPAVRGPLPPHQLVHVTRDNVALATDGGRRPLRWSTVLRWLELEFERVGLSVSWDRDFPAWEPPLERVASQIEAAERGARAWQSIGEALNPMIEVLWHHLDGDDKRLFLDRFYSRFMSHWVPIPLVTGKRLLGLLRAGKLNVARGVAGVAYDATSSSYQCRFPDRVETFDVLVDATGVPRHLAESDSPLLDSLVRQGTVSPHPLGGLRVGFDSLRVLGRDGRPDPSLYALGNLTSGTHLFTSTLELNVEKAARVAAQIAEAVPLLRVREKEAHVDATPHPS